ncbi:LysM peptidoglycan-binding domain-containing protein [Moritella sp. 5]|uniref:LysM peptidoglycan-binding domain-containing protein n=1 Tax=Moritella sp. 5 TaxID=2746231 RepID=UPI001BA5F4E3|nr:LysM peptidoglycan-binding domain-containing protein [Moritella sp. 5]QUM80627.1 LysM peptidoglycan-binding domain-containing protein [Moritella sp. 5]
MKSIPPPAQTHVVKIGDTWSSIAAKYGLAPKALLNLNMKFDKDPDSLAAGDSLQVEESKQAQCNEVDNTLPASAVKIENNTPNSTYQFNGKMLTSEVHTLKEGTLPFAMPLLNLGIKTSAIKDIDDCYLFFGDSDETLESFAEDVYGSDDLFFVEHIKNTNPHLKYSFGQIKSGMPVVVTTWKTKHNEEENTIAQAKELMTQYLTLNVDERQWFADNHDVVTEVLTMSAEGGMDSLQVNADTGELIEINLNNIIASTGAVIAGVGTQGDHISKRLKAFSDYSNYISSKTAGLTGQALYSNTDYKDWRKRERAFRGEMKSQLGQMGKPKYIKGLQAKNIGNLLNVNKRQIYRSKDFAKAMGGIGMTPLYKQAMSFSKQIKIGGWIVTGLGLYGNAADIYRDCNISGVMSETCGRSAARNLSSGIFNVTAGYVLGIALMAAPVTGGLSIVLVSAGTLAWGMYGGDKSNEVGSFIEEVIFD